MVEPRGPDGITNDILRLCWQELATSMAELFNSIISSGRPPYQWSHSEIILIHKKGARSKINNYRPISLSPRILKIFTTILKNKSYSQLDLHQGFDQAGFRKYFSTIDHIHTLSQLIEKTKEFNIEVAKMFIDFKKVFDSSYHDKIWKTLATRGFNWKL